MNAAALARLRPTGVPATSNTYWESFSEDEKLDSISEKKSRNLGRKTGWLPQGRISDRWNDDILRGIKAIVNDSTNVDWIFQKASTRPVCPVRLYMVGKHPRWQLAKPTIVALCITKKFAQRTIELLQGFDFLRNLQLGFDFLAVEDKIVLTTTPGMERSSSYSSINPCGAKILISPDPNSLNQDWTQATLGGTLLVDGSYYGLCVAHAFFDSTFLEDINATTTNGEGSDDSDDSDSLTNNDVMAEQQSINASPGQSVHAAFPPEPQRRSIYLDDRPIAVKPDQTNTTRKVRRPEAVLDADLIGDVYTNSSAVHNPGSSSWVSADKDWALFQVQNARFQMPNRIETLNGQSISCSNISRDTPRGQVIVAAGVCGVSDTECSGNKCGIVLPGSSTMLDAWTISMPSLPGDCGAWVVDPENGNVFGMIVASSQDSGESYCIPMATVIDSILTNGPPCTTLTFPGGPPISCNTPPDGGDDDQSRTGPIEAVEADLMSDHGSSGEPSSYVPIEQRSTDPMQNNHAIVGGGECDTCRILQLTCDVKTASSTPCSVCVRNKIRCKSTQDDRQWSFDWTNVAPKRSSKPNRGTAKRPLAAYNPAAGLHHSKSQESIREGINDFDLLSAQRSWVKYPKDLIAKEAAELYGYQVIEGSSFCYINDAEGVLEIDDLVEMSEDFWAGRQMRKRPTPISRSIMPPPSLAVDGESGIRVRGISGLDRNDENPVSRNRNPYAIVSDWESDSDRLYASIPNSRWRTGDNAHRKSSVDRLESFTQARVSSGTDSEVVINRPRRERMPLHERERIIVQESEPIWEPPAPRTEFGRGDIIIRQGDRHPARDTWKQDHDLEDIVVRRDVQDERSGVRDLDDTLGFTGRARRDRQSLSRDTIEAIARAMLKISGLEGDSKQGPLSSDYDSGKNNDHHIRLRNANQNSRRAQNLSRTYGKQPVLLEGSRRARRYSSSSSRSGVSPPPSGPEVVGERRQGRVFYSARRVRNSSSSRPSSTEPPRLSSRFQTQRHARSRSKSPALLSTFHVLLARKLDQRFETKIRDLFSAGYDSTKLRREILYEHRKHEKKKQHMINELGVLAHEDFDSIRFKLDKSKQYEDGTTEWDRDAKLQEITALTQAQAALHQAQAALANIKAYPTEGYQQDNKISAWKKEENHKRQRRRQREDDFDGSQSPRIAAHAAKSDWLTDFADVLLSKAQVANHRNKATVGGFAAEKDGGSGSWTRVTREDVDPETLEAFGLPWRWRDEDNHRGIILIKRHVSEDVLDALSEHTLTLKQRRKRMERAERRQQQQQERKMKTELEKVQQQQQQQQRKEKEKAEAKSMKDMLFDKNNNDDDNDHNTKYQKWKQNKKAAARTRVFFVESDGQAETGDLDNNMRVRPKR